MTSRSARSAPSTDDQSERRLLARVAGGDRAAIAELFRIYQPRLFRFIFRVTRSYAATEELVNDVMLSVWKQAATFRGESKLSTWILSIAYRQALRHTARKRLSIAPEVAPDDIPADEGALETEDWVQHGLNELPPAQRITVVLVFYLGLSYAEVATVTGCPVNTVKTRMFHARRRLQTSLADGGGEK